MNPDGDTGRGAPLKRQVVASAPNSFVRGTNTKPLTVGIATINVDVVSLGVADAVTITDWHPVGSLGERVAVLTRLSPQQAVRLSKTETGR